VMVVEVQSFSVYTIVVQVAEWLDDQLANFTREDIVIRDPNNPLSWFVIMDRNLWATSKYNRWYFYQWWNNYWFKLNNTNTDASIVNGTVWTYEENAIEWNNSFLNSW
jgi:hypothetical protein